MRMLFLLAMLALTGCAGTLSVDNGKTVKNYRVRGCDFDVALAKVECTGLDGVLITMTDFKAARYESGLDDELKYEPTPGCCGQ